MSQTVLRGTLGIPVVGIGASAGGLDAFKVFFNRMPPDSGCAFILVPYLDPTHESLMVDLLGRHTRMPVRAITDGMRIEANWVYLIPLNRYLAVDNGRLSLSTPRMKQATTNANRALDCGHHRGSTLWPRSHSQDISKESSGWCRTVASVPGCVGSESVHGRRASIC